MGPEWSDRTFARFWGAYLIIIELEGIDGWAVAIEKAMRPNRSMNVAKLQRIAGQSAMKAVVEHEAASIREG